jgi:hypothetical protein
MRLPVRAKLIAERTAPSATALRRPGGSPAGLCGCHFINAAPGYPDRAAGVLVREDGLLVGDLDDPAGLPAVIHDAVTQVVDAADTNDRRPGSPPPV